MKVRLEKPVTGLVSFYGKIIPDCHAFKDGINLQTQNSGDLLPKYRSVMCEGRPRGALKVAKT